jgi:hypothetical protein
MCQLGQRALLRAPLRGYVRLPRPNRAKQVIEESSYSVKRRGRVTQTGKALPKTDGVTPSKLWFHLCTVVRNGCGGVRRGNLTLASAAYCDWSVGCVWISCVLRESNCAGLLPQPHPNAQPNLNPVNFDAPQLVNFNRLLCVFFSVALM